MPVSVTEIADGLGIELHAEGEVSGREILEAQTRAAADQHVGRWLFAMLDQSTTTVANYSTQDVHDAAQLGLRISRRTRPGFVVAVVASSDFQFGIFRMWQLLTDEMPWRTCIFRDRALAEGWVRQEVKRAFEVELPECLDLASQA